MFAKVQIQLHALQAPPSTQDERVLNRPLDETSTKRDSLKNEKEGHEKFPCASLFTKKYA